MQDVFILDTMKGCYVWVGGRANAVEKKNGLSYAHVCRILIVINDVFSQSDEAAVTQLPLISNQIWADIMLLSRTYFC